MKRKLSVTAAALIYFTLVIHPGTARFLMPEDENRNISWDSFLKNVSCTLSPNSATAEPGKNSYPRFTVTLKYTGSETAAISWDDDFARLLWEGKFRLTAVSGTKKESTAEMKYRTSNTYSPGKTVTLNRGDTAQASLEFSGLPGRYAKNLFTNKGKVSFTLYGIPVKGGAAPLKISNTAAIDIR